MKFHRRTHLERKGHDFVSEAKFIDASSLAPWMSSKIEIFVCAVCGGRR